MGLRSYLTNSLRQVIAASKASIIKKKLLTKFHQFYLHKNSKQDLEKTQKVHQQHNSSEESSIKETNISDSSTKLDSQIKNEITKNTDSTSIENIVVEDTENKNIDLFPPGSILTSIIVREGAIVEKVYETPEGSNISVFF